MGRMMSQRTGEVKYSALAIRRSEKSHRPEAAIFRTADDDMIVQHDPEARARIGDFAGDRDVLPAGFGTAAGVIVEHARMVHKVLNYIRKYRMF